MTNKQIQDGKAIIFTDGSSRGNPGPGGWGAIVIQNVKIKMENEGAAHIVSDDSIRSAIVTELGGQEKMTTNNRMELTACMKGVAHTRKSAQVIVYTDSSYVINGITKWIKGWKRNGWMTKTKDDVLNRDLWEKLDHEASERKVEWKYVGGHVGIVGNERCDHIATDFADGNQVKLFDGRLSDYDLPNILDISHNDDMKAGKKSTSSRARLEAFSYVSRVDGVIETHRTWAECEKRVKGKAGAKYKKAIDLADEAMIIAEFEAL